MNYIPTLLCDFYKISHREMYPKGTEKIYSTWIPRASRYDYIDEVVAFGFQQFLMKLDWNFNKYFFSRDKEFVVTEYARTIKYTLGVENPDTSHIEALHDLGYLPIQVKALDEGTLVPLRVPMLTIENTLPEFFWVTNYIESYASCELWQATTSATLAHEFRKILDKYAMLTVGNTEFVQFQGHDFAMRGMSSLDSAITSGMGHLLSFVGTDTIPAINAAEYYYGANIEQELIGTSIPACFDASTEILTEDGFVLFKDLQPGKEVAQYHENGSIDFVVPANIVDEHYTGKMIQFSSGKHNYVDMVVTPNHRMLRKTNDGDLQVFEAGTQDYRFRSGYSHRNSMIVSGQVSGSDDLTARERLAIAFQADGSYASHSEDYNGLYSGCNPIRFTLKKDRKKQRLEKILAETGYTSTRHDYEDGTSSFWIKVPGEPLVKDFSWVNLDYKSSSWAWDFIQELGYWDGSFKANSVCYSSSVELNIHKVQAVAVLCGMRAQISSSEDARGDRKTQYHATVSIKTAVDGANVTKTEIDYDGRIYCVSVPSTFLVVRRNGAVGISGNSEHSIQCTYEDDYEYLRTLLEDVHPNGFVSIVSDGYDFWDVVGRVLPALKDKIMARSGGPVGDRVVIRPDSGDPVLIVCGDPKAEPGSLEYKGTVEALWDIFGGTVSEQGYKVLDSHIGVIYGDAISIGRCREICERLASKGFASINCVYGIGSYTYQYNTRDTFGFALKSTLAVIRKDCTGCDGAGITRTEESQLDGGDTIYEVTRCDFCNGVGSIPVEKPIFKDPKTDDGVKKSMKGKVMVFQGHDNLPSNRIWARDGYSLEDESAWDLLHTIYLNGKLTREQTFSQIRAKLNV